MSHEGSYIFQISCCFSFLTGQEVVGDKITLGVFSNETDWSKEKIDIKVRHFIYLYTLYKNTNSCSEA